MTSSGKQYSPPLTIDDVDGSILIIEMDFNDIRWKLN